MLAFYTATVAAIAPEAPSVWWIWALVVLACMILAAISTVGLSALVDWLFKFSQLPGAVRPWFRNGLLLVLVPVTAFSVVSLAWFGIDWIRDHRRGCTPPTEVPVVASPETLLTARSLANEYELVTARADRGCPSVNLSVYPAGSSQVQRALLANWDVLDTGGGVPADYQRDLGPRPLIWMPDSTVDVDRLKASMDLTGDDPPLGTPMPVYGWSPLVPAWPQDLDPVPHAGTLRDAITAYQTAGFDVVSPAPASSIIGQLALVAAYSWTESGELDDRAWAREIEARFSAGRDRAGYPPGDAAAVLSHYQSTGCAPRLTMLILPAQFVKKPEFAGPRVGDQPRCATGTPGRLASMRPQGTPVVNHPFVPINWESADEPASRAAAGFGRWLLSDDGAAAVRATGLEAGDRRPEEEGSSTDPEAKLDPALMVQADRVLTEHALLARPVEVLLAIDSSGSMTSRRDLGVAVLDATVERLTELDRLGLITFGGRTVRPLVQPGPAGSTLPTANGTVRDQVRAALTRIEPAGGTPLLKGIAKGVSIMTAGPGTAGTAGSPAGPSRSLVVVTDGQDTAGGPDPAGQAIEARRKGIRIFAVAAGAADCRSSVLSVITKLSDGTCIVARDDPEATADKLAAEIWGVPGG